MYLPQHKPLPILPPKPYPSLEISLSKAKMKALFSSDIILNLSSAKMVFISFHLT